MKVRPLAISFLCVICVICGGLVFAGCSPSINAWAARGLTGVQLAQSNQTAWYKAQVAQLMKDRDRSVRAAYEDTLNALAHGVATTQPVSSQPATQAALAATQPIDAAWLGVQEQMLLASLKAYDNAKASLDSAYATAMANLNSTAQCFQEIQSLNAVWATDSATLSSEIGQLQAIITSMQQSPSSKNSKRRRKRSVDAAASGADGNPGDSIDAPTQSSSPDSPPARVAGSRVAGSRVAGKKRCCACDAPRQDRGGRRRGMEPDPRAASRPGGGYRGQSRRRAGRRRAPAGAAQ